MSVNRDAERGTWMVQLRYRDYFGNVRKTTKRGFATKAQAREWERNRLARESGSLDMTFSEFFKLYEEDKRPRLRQSTWETKTHIIETKVMPFFADMRMCDIQPADVVRWENHLLSLDLSQTYLRTITNQLNAVMNHAVRFYHLPSNPVLAAGKVGSARPEHEMKVWTRAEYARFIETVADKPEVYHAFEVLYWTGLRVGELLALTAADIDLDSSIIHVRHSYQRIGGEDVVTPPKTKKSIRDVLMPRFLRDEIEDYLATRPELGQNDRIFSFTKHKLAHEISRGSEAAGVPRIRVHDLRHSHASLLIELGVSPLAIADRLGHESIEVTQTYSHLFPSAQQGVAAALDNEGGKHEH